MAKGMATGQYYAKLDVAFSVRHADAGEAYDALRYQRRFSDVGGIRGYINRHVVPCTVLR